MVSAQHHKNVDFEVLCTMLPGLRNRLREWRKRRNMTLEQASAQLDISYTTLQRLETDQLPITTQYLLALGALYDCHPLELVIDVSAIANDQVEGEALKAFRDLDNGKRAMVLQLAQSLASAKPA